AADADGAYTLEAPDATGTLVISAVGFTSQEVTIGNRTTVDVTLKTDVKSLNELRGIVSVNGSLAPLIVIDGIPGGNLDLLQQDDIESFNVLKDGSAAAIYGTRGNAGVILITTKK
nr:hypothetical protein [Tanacetum cinerariifolium]